MEGFAEKRKSNISLLFGFISTFSSGLLFVLYGISFACSREVS